MALDITTHKNVLIKILKNIYKESSLGPLLGFKGGTAAHLFYGLNRFSVDLDFDLLEPDQGDYVFEGVKKILEKYGRLKECFKKRFSFFYLLSYEKKIEGVQNIRIEINRRDFGSKYEIKSYLGISMKVMVKEDMVAHKLVALLERQGKTNRDLYDVWFFLENDWPINVEIIKKRTGMNFKDFLLRCINIVEKIDERRILAGMGELLEEKIKKWAKENLKKELLFLLRLKLENLKK